ncbi:hypothetical protein J2X65_003215 [Ancylobacter sp. 3268]|uniref:hypothetical protein n=1 Tax=Ancylobacter sp. 3268 TaxID=2817752 RepID=UPI00285921DB|nr:hypothetical protein [Ancylobacter sp. 3268]MDR6953852.1 hypothetical protein [Ancylobacter sp. 3268]
MPPRSPLEDPDHLRLLLQLPCLASGETPAGAYAHIHYPSALLSKPVTGTGMLPEDKWAVPLKAWFHTVSRNPDAPGGEEGWWERRGINPLVVATRLHAASVTLRDAGVSEAEIVKRLTAIIIAARACAC